MDIAVFRKELEEEFARCFEHQHWPLPAAFEAVVGLSQGPALEFLPSDERHDKTPELVARTRHACRVFFEGANAGSRPLLVLDGYDIQLEKMQEICRAEAVPLHCLYLLNCGLRGAANTKSQMEALRRDPLVSRLSKIVVVTSTYHVPRAARTAAAQLPPSLRWAVIGVPGDSSLYDAARKTSAEIERIIQYSATGDIVPHLKHELWRNFA